MIVRTTIVQTSIVGWELYITPSIFCVFCATQSIFCVLGVIQMATLPVEHLPMKAVEILPIISGNREIFDIGQILSAYTLDLPVRILDRQSFHIGRVMGIYREGGTGLHIIKILVDGIGPLREICLRTAAC